MMAAKTIPQDVVPVCDGPPRTWLLMGHKAGDNARVLALAEALGWPFEVKRCVYRRTELLTNLLAGPTLLGLVGERSSRLEPPWPQLVISAGRRNEPIARWVRRRAAADGAGRVRLVHLGRPWAAPDRFDLVVVTPQYHLPDGPNVLRTAAPLHRPPAPERLAAAAAAWGPRLAHLPEPRVAVLLGGSAGPYLLDRENGALLGHHASRMAAELGGALLVTSSARTPREAIDAFEEQIKVPAYLHRWAEDDAEGNPYLAFLALADRIVTTCDSISMLTEAVAARRPVFVFDLARGRGSMRPPPPGDGAVRPRTLRECLADWGWQPTVHRIGAYTGPRRLVPDLAAVHRREVAAGRAVWLGQPWPGRHPLPPLPPADDLPRAVARVRALFGMPPAEGGGGLAAVRSMGAGEVAAG